MTIISQCQIVILSRCLPLQHNLYISFCSFFLVVSPEIIPAAAVFVMYIGVIRACADRPLHWRVHLHSSNAEISMFFLKHFCDYSQNVVFLVWVYSSYFLVCLELPQYAPQVAWLCTINLSKAPFFSEIGSSCLYLREQAMREREDMRRDSNLWRLRWGQKPPDICCASYPYTTAAPIKRLSMLDRLHSVSESCLLCQQN